MVALVAGIVALLIDWLVATPYPLHVILLVSGVILVVYGIAVLLFGSRIGRGRWY